MPKYFQSYHQHGLNCIIADTIKKTYPEGIDSFDPEYQKHEGIERLNKLIDENIIRNNGNMAKAWKRVLKHVKRELIGELERKINPYNPSLSADLIMERYQDDVLIRIKRLAFAVSLIGPLYTVCGVDETYIIEKGEPGMYHAINRVTVSPYKEFEFSFNFVQRAIEAECTGYRFMPFELALTFVKDLKIHYSSREEYTVYDALFNDSFKYYQHWRSRGDRFYGIEPNPEILKVRLLPAD